MENHLTAPIPETEKALLSFVAMVNDAPWTITRADVERTAKAGWTEEAIYDAINVCALFNFYNRWNDAGGTEDLSREGYAMSGKRLATGGYGP